MYEAHATFSFVLVVIGVAILLYGTGTQGAGSFTSDIGAASYRIGVAGGAGILALCVGWGVVEYSPKMRDAFQIERKYVRIPLVPRQGISEINFGRYLPDVTTTSGEIVPALRRGNERVEIYVPYLPTERQKIVEVKLLRVESDSRPTQLKVIFENTYSIDIAPGGFGGTSGGQDFPMFSGTITALRGTNGNQEPQIFAGAITVDLVDPKQQEKEQINSDKQQVKTKELPPPPIRPSTGDM